MATTSNQTDVPNPESAKNSVTGLQQPKPFAVRDDDALSSKLCNQWVENGLVKNPSIQFLVQHLVDLGCSPPSNFIRCTKCERPQAGGFGMVEDKRGSPACSDEGKKLMTYQQAIQAEKEGMELKIKPEIFLCEQYMENEMMTHKTLVHELIHAIDMCRAKMDPVHNCLQLACTEIRAENLSGECSFIKELPRMKSFKGHGSECVKRRALLSVRANPNCTGRAEDYVTAAFPRCFRDIYPFKRHPNQQ